LKLKWESLPSLGVKTFKIGLAHRFSIIELISILSSTLTFSYGLISAYDKLRRKAGQKDLGFWKDMLLTICLAVPIISTVITSTITSIEVERDGVFVPFSDDPNQTTPGYLFPLIFGPIFLFFLTLIAFPFSFFTLVPCNQSTLQFASARMSLLSRTLRITTISLLFAFNLCSSVYFVSRDRFPEDESIFKDCSYRISGDNVTCTPGEYSSLIDSKFDFKFAHGRKLWFVLHIVLVSLNLISGFVAYYIIIKWNKDVSYRNLLLKESITEAIAILSKLHQKVSSAQSLMNKLYQIEATVVENLR
jgi:hypothetical protein